MATGAAQVGAPDETAGDAEARPPRRIWLLALLATVALGSAVRIHTALTDPAFDHERPEGMLRSDPALLYYVTERVVEADGLVPADFRADPRVQHPDPVDLAEMFTVGQEFLIGWSYRVFGGDVPLHVFCVWLMAVAASLAAVGVFGLATELTRDARWGAFAALLYALLPSNYRTIGFVLVREDLSFPLFAVHLWLAVRAARVRTPGSFVLAGLALTLALATWHAMGFIVALEAGVLLLAYLRSGRSPFAARASWIVPACVALGSLLVPVLRAKLFLLSPAMVVAAALVVLARCGPRRERALARIGAAAGTLVGLHVLAWLLARWIQGPAGDYGHVVSFVAAKLAHLGQMPTDPRELDFGARLLWQGPFATAPTAELWVGLGMGLLLLIAAGASAVPRWIREPDAFALVCALAIVGILVGWLIQRMLVLPALLAPVVGAVLLARSSWRLPLAALVLLIQGAAFGWILPRYTIPWYQPYYRAAAISHLVRWVKAEVPPDAAIVGDFITSTSVLAYTRNPIVCQPKYETLESRQRIEAFYGAFYHGTPDDLRAVAVKYEARFLLVDCIALAYSAWLGGIPPTQPAPGPQSSALYFLNGNPATYGNVPGFRLVYESPREHAAHPFRLYAVE